MPSPFEVQAKEVLRAVNQDDFYEAIACLNPSRVKD